VIDIHLQDVECNEVLNAYKSLIDELIKFNELFLRISNE